MTRPFEGPIDRTQFAKEFGARVRTFRTERRLSQAALAAITGYVPHTISNIERGFCFPPLNTVFLLAEALDIHPKILLFGEESDNG